MIETAEALPESIQRAVDLGISGIDIMQSFPVLDKSSDLVLH